MLFATDGKRLFTTRTDEFQVGVVFWQRVWTKMTA